LPDTSRVLLFYLVQLVSSLIEMTNTQSYTNAQ
jgi:hypothetical protein